MFNKAMLEKKTKPKQQQIHKNLNKRITHLKEEEKKKNEVPDLVRNMRLCRQNHSPSSLGERGGNKIKNRFILTV